MTAISDLKDSMGTSTGKLVLFTVATAGIYPLLWIVQTNGHIQRVTQSNVVGATYPIC